MFNYHMSDHMQMPEKELAFSGVFCAGNGLLIIFLIYYILK